MIEKNTIVCAAVNFIDGALAEAVSRSSAVELWLFCY
jgi:hypothetical protein